MSARPLIWIPRPVHDDALAELRAWAEVRQGWGEHAAGFDDVAGQVQGILLRTDRVDADMIRRAPRLRIVARHGAGADTVDAVAAADAGVRVTTTPGANAISVAEHAATLLLAVRRGIGQAIRGGDRAGLVGRELHDSTLGLIGLGRISRHLARIARHGFGMRVLAYDPFAPASAFAESGVEQCELDDLIRASDAVSLHVPLTDDTRNLLSATRLRLLPRGAVVINTSRGGIVDEDALLAAIADGHLDGAGLDVTSVEPLPADHPLRAHPQVIITPHVGGQTKESLRRVALEAAAALRAELAH